MGSANRALIPSGNIQKSAVVANLSSLCSMNPSFLRRFMKKLSRGWAEPIISANTHCPNRTDRHRTGGPRVLEHPFGNYSVENELRAYLALCDATHRL
jgi:hypothetical protein